MRAYHPVPRDRHALRSIDWFPHVLSKLAPLEWWAFSASATDIRREDYSSDSAFAIARQNTWAFPRFAFSMFRPSPDAYASLHTAVNEYNGEIAWSMQNSFIAARLTKSADLAVAPLTIGSMSEGRTLSAPQSDPEFVKRAVDDIPHLGVYLESRLGLGDRPAVDFDPRWLTRAGLTASRPQFEDFVEPGFWTAILAKEPETLVRTGQSTSGEDRPLSIGIAISQWDALCEELGENRQTDSTDKKRPSLPEYPLMSRMDDRRYSAFYRFGDTFYRAEEINALLIEYQRAQDCVQDPHAIRGLDNFVRIGRWAHQLKVGIAFVTQ
jgi:hypothetical protein